MGSAVDIVPLFAVAFANTWWFQTIGWIGSALVVISLMTTRVLRFRWLNAIGALIATGWNAITGMWPFVAMNGAILIIDLFYLRKLYAERTDAAVYSVIPVSASDAYVQHLLLANAADIAEHVSPGGFTNLPADGERRLAYLVVKDNETVGLVEVRDDGGGQATVLLDWVNARYRDFTPGEFVYRQSGIFQENGFTQLVVPPGQLPTSGPYLQKVGFTPTPDGGWVRAV